MSRLAGQGCRLAPPEPVLAATVDYRQEQDVLGRWLAEETEQGEHRQELSKRLWDAFTEWRSAQGEEGGPTTAATFGKELAKRGFTSEHSSVGNVWKGLSLAKRGDS